MALVVDEKNSEQGPQLRRDKQGRRIHCCCICGNMDVWRDGWSGYWSIKDEDDGAAVPKFCQPACRKAGGRAAQNVTQAMKDTAREREYREPYKVYREQTEQEKYRHAVAKQQPRPEW